MLVRETEISSAVAAYDGSGENKQPEIPKTFKRLSRRLIRIAHLNRHLRIAVTEMAVKD
jgi:hypothetical protein